MIKYREGYVESCVLVAEVDGSTYHYNVAPADIESGIKTIRATYDQLDRKLSKVYIGGFTLVTDDTNLTKRGIVERVITTENRLKNLRNNDTVTIKM